jgi:hypothetical protein
MGSEQKPGGDERALCRRPSPPSTRAGIVSTARYHGMPWLTLHWLSADVSATLQGGGVRTPTEQNRTEQNRTDNRDTRDPAPLPSPPQPAAAPNVPSPPMHPTTL